MTPYLSCLMIVDFWGRCRRKAFKYVANHPDIEVLGVIAVASKTRQAEWTRVDVCIDKFGELTPLRGGQIWCPRNGNGQIDR